MTDAEKRLWWHLKRIPVTGTHFRRQSPIGSFVADFVCHQSQLVIEVDGGQHGTEEGRFSDALRSEWLERQGYRVIRFWNHEVMAQIEVVLDTIYAALYIPFSDGDCLAEESASTPTPSPSPQGGGES